MREGWPGPAPGKSRFLPLGSKGSSTNQVWQIPVCLRYGTGGQPEFVTSLDRSLRVATSEMLDWVVRDFKMEPWTAHLLIGYQGQYGVVTVAGSIALRLQRSALPR